MIFSPLKSDYFEENCVNFQDRKKGRPLKWNQESVICTIRHLFEVERSSFSRSKFLAVFFSFLFFGEGSERTTNREKREVLEQAAMLSTWWLFPF